MAATRPALADTRRCASSASLWGRTGAAGSPAPPQPCVRQDATALDARCQPPRADLLSGVPYARLTTSYPPAGRILCLLLAPRAPAPCATRLILTLAAVAMTALAAGARADDDAGTHHAHLRRRRHRQPARRPPRSSTYVGNLHLRSLLDLRARAGLERHARIRRRAVDPRRPARRPGRRRHGREQPQRPAERCSSKSCGSSTTSRRSTSRCWPGCTTSTASSTAPQSGGLFLNSSFGIGPEFSQSGVDGPSIFPRTALGARVAYKPADGVVLRAAVLDGVPLIRDGDRLARLPARATAALRGRAGAARSPRRPARPQCAHAASAATRCCRCTPASWPSAPGTTPPPSTRLAPAGDRTRQHGATGYYAVADRIRGARHERPPAAPVAVRAVRRGRSDGFRFGRYLGAGACCRARSRAQRTNWAWPSPWRATAVPTAATGAASDHATERSIELSYLAQVHDWLAVQPDLQYVIHPDTDPTVHNALVFTLRFELSTDL